MSARRKQSEREPPHVAVVVESKRAGLLDTIKLTGDAYELV